MSLFIPFFFSVFPFSWSDILQVNSTISTMYILKPLPNQLLMNGLANYIWASWLILWAKTSCTTVLLLVTLHHIPKSQSAVQIGSPTGSNSESGAAGSKIQFCVFSDKVLLSSLEGFVILIFLLPMKWALQHFLMKIFLTKISFYYYFIQWKLTCIMNAK